jgi:hypothetical protein
MQDMAKITAADVVSGVLFGIAYWHHGSWDFPDNVHPSWFLQPDEGWTGEFTTEQFFSFVDHLGEKAGCNFGSLSPGSLPVYINDIRKGRRPNNKGRLPGPLDVKFSRKNDTITIGKREWGKDKEKGNLKFLPHWFLTL